MTLEQVFKDLPHVQLSEEQETARQQKDNFLNNYLNDEDGIDQCCCPQSERAAEQDTHGEEISEESYCNKKKTIASKE
jgi:hypothetical protein